MESSVLMAPPLSAAAALAARSHTFDSHLDPGDAARYALIDFRIAPPITVGPDRLIIDALGDMNRLGMQALLVASDEPGDAQGITGLITAVDISRRLHMDRAPATRVAEAMSRVEELPLVHFESLESLTAFDLYTLFQGTGLTHLLVVEHGEDGAHSVARGLLSRKSLASRLHPDTRVLHA